MGEVALLSKARAPPALPPQQAHSTHFFPLLELPALTVYPLHKGSLIDAGLLFSPIFRAMPKAYRVPRLGVESDLQLLAYITATATQDMSYTCN